MTHGSLFSGVGGFDLAAEWIGWENKFHCEWNDFGKQVLNYYWPNATSYGDITKTNFTIWRGRIDVLSGGFPCQPFSLAGKRKGTEDSRHLWPEMLRAIREIQPTWVVGENVPGIINWDGGLVFDQVQADLEAEGYEVQPVVLPAAGVGAPHRRDRVFFISHTPHNGRHRSNSEHEVNSGERGEHALNDVEQADATDTDCHERFDIYRQQSKQEEKAFGRSCNLYGKSAPYTEPEGLQGHNERKRCSIDRSDKGLFIGAEDKQFTSNTDSRRQPFKEHRGTKSGRIAKESIPTDWSNFPTQSPICSGNDGISSRLAGITFSKHRNESIKAYGNAVVPVLIMEIFKVIQKYENIYNH